MTNQFELHGALPQRGEAIGIVRIELPDRPSKPGEKSAPGVLRATITLGMDQAIPDCYLTLEDRRRLLIEIDPYSAPDYVFRVVGPPEVV